jgi:hypothetical protein
MVFDSIFGVNESALAYDMTRAHSADVFFLKVRAWSWGITCTIGGFLIGNIMGVFDINIFGILWDLISGLWH